MTLYRREFLSGFGLVAVVLPVGVVRRNSIWIPVINFPRPKFYLGQEVLVTWKDSDEDLIYQSPAEIIGMSYSPGGYETGWWYLPRWISSLQPWVVGRDDGSYCAEDQLQAIS